MPIILVSTEVFLREDLQVALKPHSLLLFNSASEALNHLLVRRHSPHEILVIDLDTILDHEQLIGFIKSSPLRPVSLVGIGSAATYSALSPAAVEQLAVALRSPQSDLDRHIVAATLRALLPAPN